SVEQGLTNITFVQGGIEQMPVAGEIADHVIASYVLHEVEPLSKGLQENYRTLKTSGICLCLEWEKAEMDQGPPLHHLIHSTTMQQAMEEAGFTIIGKSFPTDSHYVLLAKK